MKPSDVVAACHAAWSKGDPAGAAKLTAEDLVDHNPLLPDERPGVAQVALRTSAAGRNPDFEHLLGIFPDAEAKIEDMISEGEKVAYRWTGSGTHRGHFLGIAPTGKRVRLEGITIARVVNDKVVEVWRHFDALGVLMQLGMVQLPDPLQRAYEYLVSLRQP